jgi:hypothetical protein
MQVSPKLSTRAFKYSYQVFYPLIKVIIFDDYFIAQITVAQTFHQIFLRNRFRSEILSVLLVEIE